MYMHNGTATGTQSWISVYPEYDIGITLLMNVSMPGGSRIMRDAIYGIVDDIKPFGKKSIGNAIVKASYQNVDTAVSQYYALKKSSVELYNFEDESDLNNLGYRLLGQSKILEAIKIFQLVVEEFPYSWNAYDSLAEAYLENGNRRKAVEYYKKSISLNPDNHYAKKVLSTLK